LVIAVIRLTRFKGREYRIHLFVAKEAGSLQPCLKTATKGFPGVVTLELNSEGKVEFTREKRGGGLQAEGLAHAKAQGVRVDCSQVPWLTPIILATQEAEIRRISV
jgi:hypothetical protein